MDEQQGRTAANESRRRFLRQAGTVAWATPFVVTMMSRAAHAQLSSCGTKIDGVGTTACIVTTPCGTSLSCRGAAIQMAGAPCFCVVI